MCDPEEDRYVKEYIISVGSSRGADVWESSGDNVSGEPLDPEHAKQARRAEMDGFSEQDVYSHVLREPAKRDRMETYWRKMG